MKKQKMSGKDVFAYDNNWSACTPASEGDIAKIEKALSVKLPKELKTLLMTCAGGRPKNNFYQNDEYDIEVGLAQILPVKNEAKRDTVLEVHKQLTDVLELPDGLIPFAEDTGHANAFCVNIKSGKVVYWLHDEPDRRAREVCGSLKAFISGLTECPY